MNIYFAHGIWEYGTERERNALEAIKARWPSANVINPAKLDDAYANWKRHNPLVASEDPMLYFRQIVHNMDTVVYMPSTDMMVGPGVAAEVLEALIWGKPVYRLWEFEGHIRLTPIDRHFDEFIMTIEEARTKNKA